jgi:hypothetical protein
MNAPYTPVDLHSAFDDVTLLLAIIADPEAHRQRLKELVAQENKTKAEIETLNAMASETKRLHGTAQAVNIVCDRRLAAIEERESELDARAQSLDNSEAMKSAAAVQRRELAVEAREKAAKAESDRLAAMRTDLERRLAKIKNFSSSL